MHIVRRSTEFVPNGVLELLYEFGLKRVRIVNDGDLGDSKLWLYEEIEFNVIAPTSQAIQTVFAIRITCDDQPSLAHGIVMLKVLACVGSKSESHSDNCDGGFEFMPLFLTDFDELERR